MQFCSPFCFLKKITYYFLKNICVSRTSLVVSSLKIVKAKIYLMMIEKNKQP